MCDVPIEVRRIIFFTIPYPKAARRQKHNHMS